MFQYHKRTLTLTLMIAPALLALWAVRNEAALTEWARDRDSLLVFGLFVLVSALIHPRLQRALIVTLCYGVASLALRDSLHVWQYSGFLSLPLVGLMRLVMLGGVAALSIIAAVTEARIPCTITARRCYTGAAAFYFIDHGILSLIWQQHIQALVFLLSGVICGVGCLFSHRIMRLERPQEAPAKMAAEFEERMSSRPRAVTLREWQDNSEAATEGSLALQSSLSPLSPPETI